MSRYVSLATDAAPTYAVHAPVVARLWKQLGYDAIVHVHEAGWENDFGRLILHELAQVGARVIPTPVLPPLVGGNIMRVARLLAAAQSFVHADDFVLCADMDMYPLSRSFFAVSAPFIALRALYHEWLMPAASVPPDVLDRLPQLLPGSYRFTMSYFGATGKIWRELFDLVPDDVTESLRRLLVNVDPTYHNVDLDETLLSAVVLRSPRAMGDLLRQPDFADCRHWRQGELHLIDPVYAPNLTGHDHMPRGLLRLADGYRGQGTPPEGAIDFIPPRFSDDSSGGRGWWCFDVATAYYPQEAAWLAEYRTAAKAIVEAENRAALWPSTWRTR